MLEFLERIAEAGPAALLAYGAVFMVANIAFVPATVLTLAGGCTFGFAKTASVVLLARPASSVVGFVLARRLLRNWVAPRVAGRPRLQAIDRALRADALRVITLLRLSPILPSTVSSYALGTTSVPLRAFAIGSAVGTIPSTLLYAYLGSGAHALALALSTERARHPGEYAIWALGLLATVVVVVTLARAARAQLRVLVPEVSEHASGGPGLAPGAQADDHQA